MLLKKSRKNNFYGKVINRALHKKFGETLWRQASKHEQSTILQVTWFNGFDYPS